MALRVIYTNLQLTRSFEGMAQLDAKSSGRIGVRALTYYMVTTILAAIVGIVVVLLIHPGNPKIKSIVAHNAGGGDEAKVSTLDAILDIIRYLLYIYYRSCVHMIIEAIALSISNICVYYVISIWEKERRN